MASRIRVARNAYCSRKSGRCRDCAASTASSINSSAFFDNPSWNSALPRLVAGTSDGLVFILRTDERELLRVSTCEPLLLLHPTGESQCESIACPCVVAKSPTRAVHRILSPSQPETTAVPSPGCLRQVAHPSPAISLLQFFHNLLLFQHLPRLVSIPRHYLRAAPPWHPACLLLCGASSNPMRSCVDEN